MAQPFFLNPNTGFNPSSAQQMNHPAKPGAPARPSTLPGNLGGKSPQGFTGYTQQPNINPTAVRPTEQGGPQAAWMQNMATFAGGGLQGSPALGNQQPGPVRRLVDVLGQQPFGEDNPMTLLMQALQKSKMGLGQDIGLPTPQTTTPPARTPSQSGPARPSPFPTWFHPQWYQR